MTSSEPPAGAAARRPRRAVRHAGTVGGADANLVSTHPAFQVEPPSPETAGVQTPGVETAGVDAAREVVPDVAAAGRSGDSTTPTARPAHEPVVATRSADDSDVGWGDREAGSNDDRLHQDKPPHW